MNEKFLNLLRNIDLTTCQIKIYQAVMKLGMPTVFELGEHLKTNRPAVYKDTSILLEKGILELGSNKPRKFLAVNPRRIKTLIEEKQDKLNLLESGLVDAESYFLSRVRNFDNDINIKIFEDRNISRAYLFESEDAKNSEVLIITGHSNYMDKYFDSSFFSLLLGKYMKNKVSVRVIAHPNDKLTIGFFSNPRYKNFQIKTLGSLDMKVAIDIWNDKTIISSFEAEKAKAVLIENKIMVDGYKVLFENLWKIASF